VPPDLPSPLADAEYPFLLRGLRPSNPLVIEFEEQISLFRRLVLESTDVELSRYSGALTGELGLRTRRQLAYPRVRAAVPGFVTEIVDVDVWARLEAAEYSSLLADGRRRFILFGPLALVMDGKDDVWFGPVSSYIRWESYDPATKAFGRGDKEEGVRQIFLGGVPKTGEVRKKPRATFGAGDEIVVPYSGMRKVSHFPAAVPDRGDREDLAVLTAELDHGNLEMSVASELGRLGESRKSAAVPSGNSTRKESGRGRERSKTPLTDMMMAMARDQRSATVPPATSSLDEPSAEQVAVIQRKSYKKKKAVPEEDAELEATVKDIFGDSDEDTDED